MSQRKSSGRGAANKAVINSIARHIVKGMNSPVARRTRKWLSTTSYSGVIKVRWDKESHE